MQAAAKSRADELRQREEALAQRESESGKRIHEATLQLNADRERLTREQADVSALKKENTELQLKLEATEADLAQREKALAENSGKLYQEEARLASKRNAIAAVEEGQRQRETELARLEKEARERAADLAHHAAQSADAALAARAMVSAARLCLRFFANDEASALAGKGLQWVEQLTSAAERVCLTLELREAMLQAAPEAIRELLGAGAVTPEAVADATIDGLAEERFLILPHPEVHDYVQRKASDRDRWLRGMRRLQRELERRVHDPHHDSV